MRRRAARIDPNQPGIVQALRDAGATVRSLAQVGDGCPDLLVGFRGVNWLLEVKDEDSKRGTDLTESQARFFAEWKGQSTVVTDVDSALRAIGAK